MRSVVSWDFMKEKHVPWTAFRVFHIFRRLEEGKIVNRGVVGL